MTNGAPKPVLSQFDAIAIIVGVVIGAGIFRLPSLVAGNIGTDWMIVAVWLLGGAIALIGALCFAELVSAHPDAGGEYHFLHRAYGRSTAFMFAWARMSVVQTGSIALLGYIFGDYASQLVPIGEYGSAIYAAGGIIVLTLLNIAGVRETKAVQNVLFSATFLGLVCIILTGLLLLAPVGPEAAPAPREPGTGLTAAGFGLAMIFVLLTYGGWNESAYISAEVSGGHKRMVGALLISIGLITAIYVLVNFVYVWVLGPEGMAKSQAVASDLMRAAFGDTGAVAITVLILIVVLASMNVTILTGARTNFALGRDFPVFRFLGRWNEGKGTPTRSYLLQGAIALGLVGLGTLGRRGPTGVETIIDYLSPVFWLFFLLIGLSLFVLRRREPEARRPFRVPFYPITPILFCLTSAYMFYSSLNYTGLGALVGVAVLAAGLPLLYLSWRMESRGKSRLSVQPSDLK